MTRGAEGKTGSKVVLRDLQGLVKEIEKDLDERAARSAEIDQKLREAHSISQKRGQTAEGFEAWLQGYLTQAAVSWVLACIFVRYLEDNALVEECLIAGEGGRRTEAEERQETFFRRSPDLSEREYLESTFEEVGRLPAVQELFAKGKNPLWGIGPQGDGARRLLEFFRETEPATGKLLRTFRTPEGDTRFLGDLYQDLSEEARKRYALLQTPVFVEEFILDRTLTPAIDEFGLENVRLLDPTCGSGHFLLGAFGRIFDLWQKREPGTNPRELAARALNAVWGIDINPFAVAIARFRLTVAGLHATGIRRLKEAPAWPLHVAAGDSLLHGSRFARGSGTGIKEGWIPGTERYVPQIYAVEEPVAVSKILGQQYHVVVGNPPYITVKDKAQNAAYRSQYSTCHRQYSLGVPFTERFFELAIAAQDGRPAGHVGMITANSFMKREFGKKLIEEYLRKVDLTHVIDTSGAYIPGHGTPTVILFGRNRPPLSDKVRGALSIRGEPATPADPAQGSVWRSIVDLIDQGSAQNEFVTITDLERSTLGEHPWSIGGGGAAELKEKIDGIAECTVESLADAIGFAAITGEDEVFAVGGNALRRFGIEHSRSLVLGDSIRDWCVSEAVESVWVYSDDFSLKKLDDCPNTRRYLWPFKSGLAQRKRFGVPMEEGGYTWYEWRELYYDRLRTPLSIAFAFVATHNHFVLDRGGKVFKQSAPIIKLSPGSSEEDHLVLLGLLNSSTACFWMKQVFHCKGAQGINEGGKEEKWEQFFEFATTQLQHFPISAKMPLYLSSRIDKLSGELMRLVPSSLSTEPTTTNALAERRSRAQAAIATMISLQEELDWQCYSLYGILSDDLCHRGEPPPLRLGERAFEIILARKVARGKAEPTWFERHGSKPITEIPVHWPEGYRSLVERRIALIESNPDLALIEAPEHKRRWSLDSWEEQESRALRNWLLDRLESDLYWPRDTREPRLRSAADIADQVARDHDFLDVAALWKKRTDFDLKALITELLEDEAVPFLPGLRYSLTGLKKRKLWEDTWEKQRAEDHGENVGKIPVPPRYASGDFKNATLWRLRGKLDVPRERFVSYPLLEHDADPTPVFAWAGWSHLQQATALATYFDERRERDGWKPERLLPILQGLLELVPWLLQWHNEAEPQMQLRLGEFYRDFVPDEARKLGLTIDNVRAWMPPERKPSGRKGRKKKETIPADREDRTP